MARLREPVPEETTIFVPPATARTTRSSPRKACAGSTDAQEDESAAIRPRSSSRRLRYAESSSDESEGPALVPKSIGPINALTPRKQRALRPVASNTRLLRKVSNESLASPEKRQRERRVRSGTTDTDIGKKERLQYSQTLVRSVVRRQAHKSGISVVDESEILPKARNSRKEAIMQQEQTLEIEEVDEEETSMWCGDEEEAEVVVDEPQEEEEETLSGEEDEDDGPVPATKYRQRQPAARRVISDSEEDEEEEYAQDRYQSKPQVLQELRQEQKSSERALPVLTSMRPPHRKGHSNISNWAQELIDLTDSPEPPASFVFPPLTHVRTSSFAASRPTTSSSHGAPALLTYSPTPTKKRSPCKAPPLSRPGTPPLAPLSPSKLVSPSKKKPAIPKAAHLDSRPSLDGFWNPTEVNEWNEKHSPAKLLVSPKKQKWRDDIVKMMEGVALSDSDSDEGYASPTTTSPKKKKPTSRKTTTSTKTPNPPADDPSTPTVAHIRAQRKAFAASKHSLATSFLTLLDTTLCAGRISSLTASTGGIKLIWSSTLKTTAGRANWRREQIRLRTGPSPLDPIQTEIRHHCSIELASKVIDSPPRLYNVLAHEFCHLTTFLISEVRNNPHGKEFKSWGHKASLAFGEEYGVEVTTKHTYQIEYKYVWECVACGYEFKRHSKSVDTQRHSCGKCKGRLVQTRPTPRGAGKNAAGAADGEGGGGGGGKAGEYQLFVKQNFARVKSELKARGEEAKMGKVIEVVAREYRERKGKKDKGEVQVDEVELALEGLKI